MVRSDMSHRGVRVVTRQSLLLPGRVVAHTNVLVVRATLRFARFAQLLPECVLQPAASVGCSYNVVRTAKRRACGCVGMNRHNTVTMKWQPATPFTYSDMLNNNNGVARFC